LCSFFILFESISVPSLHENSESDESNGGIVSRSKTLGVAGERQKLNIVFDECLNGKNLCIEKAVILWWCILLLTMLDLRRWMSRNHAISLIRPQMQIAGSGACPWRKQSCVRRAA
jgi:hypothetical protein